MRRSLALVGAAAIAAVSAAPIVAAPSQRVTDTQTVIFCEGLQNENEDGIVFAFAVDSELQGSFGSLAFWADPLDPESSNPTWISGPSTVDISDTSVLAMYELFEFVPPENPEDPPVGEPVGTAVLDATLAPAGDPQPFSFEDRQGNSVFRVSGVTQELSVTGTINLPEGISYDASGCSASRESFTQFSNQPASSVFRSSEFVLSCMWTVDDTFVFLFASGGPFGTFADVHVSGPDGDFSGFTEAAELTTSAFSASWDIFEFTDEGPVGPVGAGDAAATLSPTGERINDRFSFGNFKVHITGELYAAAGTLNVTTSAASYELPMDTESCFAADQVVTEHQSARQGEPSGRPVPNDTPDAAAPIGVGEVATLRTRGTALDPEEPCIGTFDGEVVEFPIGHTAWWTFVGTGGPVTVDTAGSDFDTVVGVYVDEGGSLVPVGCVDDLVDSLQARITVETDADLTYFIQAGGFAGAVGSLTLSVRDGP